MLADTFLTFGDKDLINMNAVDFSGMPDGLMTMAIAWEDEDGDAYAIPPHYWACVLFFVLALP